MKRRDRNEEDRDSHKEARGVVYAKVVGVDLAFGIGALVLASALGFAFEDVTASLILAGLGIMFAWAVWKEFQHRNIRRVTENDK